MSKLTRVDKLKKIDKRVKAHMSTMTRDQLETHYYNNMRSYYLSLNDDEWALVFPEEKE